MSIPPDDRLTLVLVHGAGSSATIWDRMIPLLGDRWRILAPDLPGHGGEPGPGRPTVEGYATWLEAYLASQTNGPVVLAGHSMGGAIALLVALRRRVRLAGLILIDTGARLRVAPEFLAGLQTDFAGTLKRSAQYAFAASSPDELKAESGERLRQAGQEVVHGDFVACDGFDVMARLGEIELPTLVLCGSEDQMTPPKYAQYLAAGIAGARLEMLDGAGHMAPAERPAAMAEALADFLDELTEDRGDLDHYGL
jgi:pimeloyl-ACP methyl ester carboxylesterase